MSKSRDLADLIADSIVGTDEIADNAITTAKINDGAITAAKLESGAAVPDQTGNSGKYLTTDGTDTSWGTVNTDLVADTTPQLGGTLDANGNTIDMGVNVITDTAVGNWNTAYGWGDHSGAGYALDSSLGALATANSVNASTIDDNSVGAAELNVSGNGTSGQALLSDGDGTFSWGSAGADTSNQGKVRVYTSSSTWTKPAGLSAVKVTVVGGGGGGGGTKRAAGASPNIAGQGGGGGASIEWIPAPSIPGPVSVTVGAGGAAGPAPPTDVTATAGGTGGTSSFGAFLSATGGAGAISGSSGTPGAGGSGSGGNINIPGGRSRDQGRGSSDNGSLLAHPNHGMLSFGPGQTGTPYGGGGTGAYVPGGTSTPYAGAAGAPGVVIIEEFY